MKVTELINKLKQDVAGTIAVSIFVFTDQITKRKYGDSSYMTFKPIMIRCYTSQDFKEHTDIKNCDYSISCSLGKNKNTHDHVPLNTLFFRNVTESKNYKGYDYYQYEINATGKSFEEMLLPLKGTANDIPVEEFF